MIKPGFIKKQVAKTRQSGRCTPFLAELTLCTAACALREHYGENYSIRCLQSSLAIQSILKRFGIRSTIWGEHVCVAEAFDREPRLGWGGFYNEEHHIWLCTELLELVDLTISQLHIHPAVTRAGMIPVPSIWWQEVDRWPTTIQYLPTARINPGLQGEEKKDLDDFLRLVPDVLDRVLSGKDVSDISFGPILYGENSMNELFAAGNPWLVATLPMHRQNVPLPAWVEGNVRELADIAMMKTK